MLLALACAKGEEKAVAPAPAAPAAPTTPAAATTTPTPSAAPAPATPAAATPAAATPAVPTTPTPIAAAVAAAAPAIAARTPAAEPLPKRLALQRPPQPGPGGIHNGLEGYDLSRPQPNEFQAKDKSAQLLLQYSADKLPLWTKASYGGEGRILGWANATAFSVFGPQHGGRYIFGGHPIRLDMGRCSFQGKTDMSRCDGRRAEIYSSVLVPDIFIRWEVPDPLTYVFHMRKGVLWPAMGAMNRVDREVTAEDMVWYFETMKKEGLLRNTFELVATMAAVDRSTVKVTLKSTQVDFLRNLSNRAFAVIPKECYDKTACADKNLLVSPGPFLITKVVTRQSTVFEKNPEYHIAGVPWLDRIVSNDITDPASQKAAFITGQLDQFLSFTLTEAQSLIKQGRPGVQLHVQTATSVVQNLRPKLEGPLADLRVRRALMMAVDFQAAWEIAAEGVAFMGMHMLYDYLGLTMPIGLAEAGPNFQYNPEAARKLLAEAGYPNGFSTSIQTTATSGSSYEMFLAVQSFWKKNLNVEARIRSVDGVAHTSSLLEKKWEGMHEGWTQGAVFDADSTFLFLVSYSAQNYQGLNDPVIDDIFQKQRGELDPAKRQTLLWQYQHRIWDQLWQIPLRHIVYFQVMQPWEMNASNHISAFISGINGSTWTHMFDLSKMPAR
jgi:peptide/nickel transport system substrate-binding protein